MSADLWQRGCERLAAELPEQQFNTWIRPLPAADVADGVVTLRVPNRFKLDWIRNQYAGRIESVLTDLAGKPVRLDITLASRDTAPPAYTHTLPQPSSPASASAPLARLHAVAPSQPAQALQGPRPATQAVLPS